MAAGHYEPVEEALAVAVADLMAIHNDDLAWARPYVDQARASVARGDVISGEQYFKRLRETPASLRS